MTNSDNIQATHDFHPASIFMPSDDGPGSDLRDLLQTFLLSSAIGLGFFMLFVMYRGWPTYIAHVFTTHLIIANSIGFSIHGLARVYFKFLCRYIAPTTARHKTIVLFTLSITGFFIGYPLGTWLAGLNLEQELWSLEGMLGMLLSLVVVCLLLAALTYLRSREASHKLKLAAEREQRALSERGTMEAELRMLQAQIEPHFLYNTLGGVVSLIDVDPQRARQMLERFIDYLRASLNASRASQSTVADEVKSVRALLDILALRMGPRLHFMIDIDADVQNLSCPPMLLQPLVENAIKHGLEPKLGGGEIQIVASRQNEQLHITVADTGVGIGGADTAGTGVGLSNLRERLTVLFGSQASLTLQANQSGGVIATLALPIATKDHES